MDNNTNPQNPNPPAPQAPAPQVVPQAPLPLDHSKTPNPQTPIPAAPAAQTAAQIVPKHNNFPLHKALLIAVIVLAILFITAYAGVYYLLNQQLDKMTNARKQSAQNAAQSSPIVPSATPVQVSPTPLPDEAHFPTGQPATPSAMQVACTQEAKLCSDGKTYVSRTGPNCEFAACP